MNRTLPPATAASPTPQAFPAGSDRIRHRREPHERRRRRRRRHASSTVWFPAVGMRNVLSMVWVLTGTVEKRLGSGRVDMTSKVGDERRRKTKQYKQDTHSRNTPWPVMAKAKFARKKRPMKPPNGCAFALRRNISKRSVSVCCGFQCSVSTALSRTPGDMMTASTESSHSTPTWTPASSKRFPRTPPCAPRSERRHRRARRATAAAWRRSATRASSRTSSRSLATNPRNDAHSGLRTCDNDTVSRAPEYLPSSSTSAQRSSASGSKNCS
jgi:hypothetical protein